MDIFSDREQMKWLVDSVAGDGVLLQNSPTLKS